MRSSCRVKATIGTSNPLPEVTRFLCDELAFGVKQSRTHRKDKPTALNEETKRIIASFCSSALYGNNDQTSHSCACSHSVRELISYLKNHRTGSSPVLDKVVEQKKEKFSERTKGGSFADEHTVAELLSEFGAEIIDVPHDGACQFHLMAR